MWPPLIILKIHSSTVFSSSCSSLDFCVFLPLEQHRSRCSLVIGKCLAVNWPRHTVLNPVYFEVWVSSRSSYLLFFWASADAFSFSVHLTIVTNLYNRPKNPGRWIPKKNWSRLPLSKRRELCTSRYVSSCTILSISRNLLTCQLIVLIVPTLNFINNCANSSYSEFYQYPSG